MIGGAFQSIDCVCFHINWEEVNPELLLKVSPGSDGENTSVYFFLKKHVFRLLGSMTTFEEHESPKNLLFFVVELFRGQADVQGAGV